MSLSKKLEKLSVEGFFSSKSLSTKPKHYLLPMVAVLIIVIILGASFLILFSNTLTPSSSPDIPEIKLPYTTPELLWKTPAFNSKYTKLIFLNGVICTTTNNYKTNSITMNATDGNIIWNGIRLNDSNSSIASTDIDKVIYVQNAFDFYAFNVTNGNAIWNRRHLVNIAQPVINDTVYAIDDHSVIAVDAKDGVTKWEYILVKSGSRSMPVVANGILYITAYDWESQTVFALNAKTGKLIWTFQTNGTIGTSSPAVADGVVYVGSDDHNLYALNAKTGRKMWSYKTGGEVGSPTVEYGVVYVGSKDQNIYALNAQTGKKLWTYNTSNDRIYAPVVANGVVYVAADYWQPTLYALNAANGEKLWNYPGAFGEPILVNEILYITDGLNVYAFSTIKPLISP